MMMFDSLWIAWVAAGFLSLRLFRREASRGELAVVAVFALNLLLIQAQHLIEGRSVRYLDWRYHMPAWPLLMILCGGACACLALRGRKWGRLLAFVLLAACIAKPAQRAFKRHQRNADRREAIAEADRWAADIVCSDWKGASRGAWTFEPREYRTDRLPVVMEQTGYVAATVGGRMANVETRVPSGEIMALEMPDYLCGERAYFGELVGWYLSNGGELVATHVFRGREFVLCRRAQVRGH